MVGLDRAVVTAACAGGGAIVVFALAKLWHRVHALEAELRKSQQLRLDERAGRTAAERRLRQAGQASGSSAGNAKPAPQNAALHSYRPIGHLESCFVERRGTPRQGLLVPDARARLQLDARVIQPAAALDGLSNFSHVWLVYEFHENTNASKAATPGGGSHQQRERERQVRAKVHPPGLGGDRIGLFATRTPHRPNPIGLSVVRLLAVEKDTLVLGGADLIDGTPILDVKPYLRHDAHADARVPEWCEKRTDSSLIAEVRFDAAAAAELAAAVARRGLRFYTDAAIARRALEQTLMLDIRTVHQGRGQAVSESDGQLYTCRFDALHVEFRTYATHVLVTRCTL